MLTYITKILERSVRIPIEPRRYVGFHLRLDTHRTHLAKILILCAEDSLRIADHVLQIHIEGIDFDLKITCCPTCQVVQEAHIEARVSLRH